MAFSLIARQQALDAITVDRVSLHDGDPGTTGENYISDGGKQAATFGAATAGGERLLSGDIAFTGLATNASVTHFGVWLAAGDVFKCGESLTGDSTANAAGEYTLKGTTTKITT